MTDRAAFLEPHDLFEGVGAHELNPRYSHVDGYDGDGFDPTLQPTARTTPALIAARTATLATRTASEYRLNGIDGSHHQPDAGPADLAVVHAIPTAWCAWKATQSTSYVDPTFVTYRKEMAKAGFRARGLYHWLSSTTDPVRQADHFVDTIGTLVDGEFVMLDAEEAGITEPSCVAWAERVEKRIGRPCAATYTGLYVAGGAIYRSTRLRSGAFGVRPVVLAAYVTKAVLAAKKAAAGVTGLVDHAQQYSSDGPVAGITGRCDMDQVNDWPAFDAITRAAAVPAPIPPSASDPEEGDMKLIVNKESRTIGGEVYGPGHAGFKLPDAGPAVAIASIAEFRARSNYRCDTDPAGLAADCGVLNADIDALLVLPAPSSPTVAHLKGTAVIELTPEA